MSKHLLALSCVVVAALLSIASSAPPPRDDDGYRTISFQLENQYAESIFTLSYAIELPDDAPGDGGAWEVRDGESDATLFEEKRLEIYEAEVVTDVVTVPVGSRIHVSLVARSLGEEHSFDGLEDPEDGMPGIVVTDSFSQTTLLLEYDYDLANAAFSVGYGWSY